MEREPNRQNKRSQVLWSLRSINGIGFGCSQDDMLAQLGEPDKVVQNADGEVEFHFQGTIYRCFLFEFVECSFPGDDLLSVDGAVLFSALDWLAARDDVVDKARFRISLAHGIAFDYRLEGAGSVTVFGAGRWDHIVNDFD